MLGEHPTTLLSHTPSFCHGCLKSAPAPSKEVGAKVLISCTRILLQFPAAEVKSEHLGESEIAGHHEFRKTLVKPTGMQNGCGEISHRFDVLLKDLTFSRLQLLSRTQAVKWEHRACFSCAGDVGHTFLKSPVYVYVCVRRSTYICNVCVHLSVCSVCVHLCVFVVYVYICVFAVCVHLYL